MGWRVQISACDGEMEGTWRQRRVIRQSMPLVHRQAPDAPVTGQAPGNLNLSSRPAPSLPQDPAFISVFEQTLRMRARGGREGSMMPLVSRQGPLLARPLPQDRAFKSVFEQTIRRGHVACGFHSV